MKKFADIHTHSTLKPFSLKSTKPNDPRSSLWYQDKPKKRQRDDDIVRYTQSDFTTLIQGNVKIVFVSLYPLEQGWFASHSTGIIVDFLAHLFTDFSIHRINEIQSKKYDYFDEVQKEYSFLQEEISSSKVVELNNKKEQFWAKMPTNKNQLDRFMQEQNTLVVVPTIEGANCLISGNSHNIHNLNIIEILRNIDTIKKWAVPPFFLTLSHHFFNGMTGHARSIFGKNRFQEIFKKILLNQAEGIDSNITKNGWIVIKSLLGVEMYRNNGKRILIDTKHLNGRSRIEFYNFILSYNLSHQDDKIPLINSHCAYNNQKSIIKTMKTDAFDSQVFTDPEYFNEAELNITNEDVKIIYKTEGLIGLNLDERILSSKKVIDIAKKEFNATATEELRLYWAKQIVRNIMAMVEVVVEDNLTEDNQNVWDIFAIGSDFDGFINPVDAYISAAEFKELDYYLIQAFNDSDLFSKYKYNYSSADVTNKFLYKNASDFLNKHYWKEKEFV